MPHYNLKCLVLAFFFLFNCLFIGQSAFTADELTPDLEQHLDFFKSSSVSGNSTLITESHIPGKAESKKYTHGFRIDQYNMEPGDSVADNPIPPAELGGFVAKKSEYTYGETINKVGVPFTVGRLFRAFGYLNVTAPGKYTIIVTSDQGREYGAIFINNRVASNKYFEFGLSITASAAFSKPGIYPVDVRIYSSIIRDLTASDGVSYAPAAKFKIQVKTPDADLPLPAHKVLILPLN